MEALLAQQVRHLCQRSSKDRLLASGLLFRGRQLLQAADLVLQADLCELRRLGVSPSLEAEVKDSTKVKDITNREPSKASK